MEPREAEGFLSMARAATELDPVLDKPYEPRPVETRWGREWEERGYFRAADRSEKPPFSIVLPPPNVTGSLHIGHALTATLEEALVRYKRMSGFNALWLPGIDHAGIAISMGSRGDAYDNAVAESFFATLKKELINRRSWPTRRELGSAVFEYIEAFYNRDRRHSTLGMRSPAEYEQLLYAAQDEGQREGEKIKSNSVV